MDYKYKDIHNFISCNYKNKYNWKHDMININGYIEFQNNNKLITPWGNGTYEILNNNYLKTFWCNDCHLLKFYDNYNKFISVRRIDNNLSSGEVIY